jgi:hypothetical protein
MDSNRNMQTVHDEIDSVAAKVWEAFQEEKRGIPSPSSKGPKEID